MLKLWKKVFNKKERVTKRQLAFMLIELVAIIIVLAVIFLVAGPTVMDLVGNVSSSAYASQVELIEDGAYVYRLNSDNAETAITMDMLLDEEILEDYPTNPINEEPMTGVVLVEESDEGILTYTYYESENDNDDPENVYEVTYEYTGEEDTYVVPADGIYEIVACGASGGEEDIIIQGSAGRGGRVRGRIRLRKRKRLYLYVGGTGDTILTPNSNAQGGYNGGGNGVSGAIIEPGAGGGGATDIRLTGGQWNNFGSLKSRIIIAAGGSGGGDEMIDDVGHGGGINGQGQNGGRQNGNNGNGRHGQGGNANVGGGGGSGYYGGGAEGSGESGGSSYISGHHGCNAIDETSTEENIVHTDQPDHYSGYIFDSTEIETGVCDGNGYVTIRLIEFE